MIYKKGMQRGVHFFFCIVGLGCQKTLLNNVFFDLYLENLTRVVFDVI